MGVVIEMWISVHWELDTSFNLFKIQVTKQTGNERSLWVRECHGTAAFGIAQKWGNRHAFKSPLCFQILFSLGTAFWSLGSTLSYVWLSWPQGATLAVEHQLVAGITWPCHLCPIQEEHIYSTHHLGILLTPEKFWDGQLQWLFSFCGTRGGKSTQCIVDN